ncbi:MAG: D-glycero-D-manno-heptose 1,7-bisphosphate phosphatase [Phycisphaerales bacterium]|jgi:D-glycero-D-manno-heptose 1,7-bisphosphate phosphatase
MLKPAVFLDRDDTINRNADLPREAWGTHTTGDLLNPEFAVLLPGVAEALASLKAAGFVNILITNQGGVARGGGTVDDIDRVNDAIRNLLEPVNTGPVLSAHEAARPGRPKPVPPLPPVLRGTLIDAAYACPHHPTGGIPEFKREHPWRKPNPGMITAAAEELGLDLARSWMVGDKPRDLHAAMAAGVDEARCLRVGPGAAHKGLAEATRVILENHEMGAAAPQPIPASRITLRAHCTEDRPRPLGDERTQGTVLAAARGLAERTGITMLEVETADTYLVATLAIGRIPAMGFAAELRKITNDWHKRRHGEPLWLEPERND